MKMYTISTRILTLALCIAMLLALAVPAYAANDIGASVNVNNGASGNAASITALSGTGFMAANAYVYSEASITSKKIVMLSKNIEVTYLGEQGAFNYITYTNASGKTYTGFVEKGALTQVNPNPTGSSAKSALTRTVEAGKSSPSATIVNAMAAAKAKNSDVVGYISIANTNIQQPILFSANDVHYYTNHDLNKKSDKAGMAYLFYGNLYRNNVLTAHNMRGSNRLFHQLHHIQEKSLGYSQCLHSKCPSRDLSAAPDLNNAANRIWDISILGYNKWEVFSMYEVKKDEPKSTINTNINFLAGYTDAQVQSWMDNQLNRSEIKFGTKVTTQDTFLTIYTCGTEYDSSSAQSRLYYFLKAVA